MGLWDGSVLDARFLYLLGLRGFREMCRKKMLMLATTAAMIEQFNKDNIIILEEMGYEIHVAGNWREGNPISRERLEEFKRWLIRHHGKWFHIPAVRRPADLKNNAKAYSDVVRLMKEYHYEFIHCHTPIGSVIGRLAAKRTHTKIIYTAHGFHFFKGAPLKNWLLYFSAEWVCSWITDVLITINTEDYECAKKHLHAKKTVYIPGVGADVARFADCVVDKRKKREEIGLSADDFVIISVGELNANKNHIAIIKALVLLKNPNVKYLICGQGELEGYLNQKIKDYGLDRQVMLLGYRTNIKELLKMSDLFAFPSKREGMPMALMEAMASGMAVVGSDIRGVRDLLKTGVGGYKEQPNNYTAYARDIEKCIKSRCRLYVMGRNNQETVVRFDKSRCGEIMVGLYGQI